MPTQRRPKKTDRDRRVDDGDIARAVRKFRVLDLNPKSPPASLDGKSHLAPVSSNAMSNAVIDGSPVRIGFGALPVSVSANLTTASPCSAAAKPVDLDNCRILPDKPPPGRKAAAAWRAMKALWPGGPPRSRSYEEITGFVNEWLKQEKNGRDLAGVSAKTVSRVLDGTAWLDKRDKRDKLDR